MSQTAVKIVFCTFPNIEKARQIGTVLVERQLVACANLIPKIESIYCWEGKVERADEVLGVFKVSESNYAALEVTLSELHPYDVPEVIAVDVEAGLPAYLRWVAEGK